MSNLRDEDTLCTENTLRILELNKSDLTLLS